MIDNSKKDINVCKMFENLQFFAYSAYSHSQFAKVFKVVKKELRGVGNVANIRYGTYWSPTVAINVYFSFEHAGKVYRYFLFRSAFLKIW